MPGGNHSYVFPDLSSAQSALLCIPVPLIPFFRQYFAEMQKRYLWRTHNDWIGGYQAFAALEEELMAGCIQQLIAEQQRLYRLIDTSMNGTEYTLVGDVVTPALPAVPPASVNATNSLRAHVTRIWQLAENEVAGVTAGPGEGVAGALALPDNQSTRAVLRRLVAGIDGNTTPAPVDNLLQALRGTAAATTDRNLTSLIDQVENLLTEIRDKLV